MDNVEISKLSDELHSLYKEWGDGLLKSEVSVLSYYKGIGHNDLNSWLLGAFKSEKTANWVKILDKALSKAPAIDRNLIVFRGIESSDPLAKAKAGNEGQAKTFFSSSISPKIGEKFASVHKGGKLVEILVPQGFIGGAYVNEIPRLQLEEFEFLFRPGVKYKVIKNEPSIIIIELIVERKRRARITPQRNLAYDR